MSLMAKQVGLTPDQVRRAYLRAGADYTAAAKLLGVTDRTVRYHMDRATPPLVVPSVNMPGLDPKSEDAQAVAAYVRLMLERAGVKKE